MFESSGGSYLYVQKAIAMGVFFIKWDNFTPLFPARLRPRPFYGLNCNIVRNSRIKCEKACLVNRKNKGYNKSSGKGVTVQGLSELLHKGLLVQCIWNNQTSVAGEGILEVYLQSKEGCR